MKQKNLNKRIRRLEQSIAKGMKKLAKLRGKLAGNVKRSGKKAKPAKAATSVKTKSARVTAPRQKKKRKLSPEAREKLAARMRDRWAAKKAAAAGADTQIPDGAGSPS
jgi:hypothetical protein